MSEEYTPNPLQVAYNAALDGSGREAANNVCKAHGVTDQGSHPWRRVPSNRAAACVKALEALAGSKPKPRPAATRGFEQVRREAFARAFVTPEREAAPTPPKRLDPVAIFERWNNPPPVED